MPDENSGDLKPVSLPFNSGPDNRNQAAERSEGLRDLILAIVFCLAAVILVRSFLVEPFKIPSSSMVPTLRIGDHIFVTKFRFGLFVPFTKNEFLRTGDPKRGDVIVFLYPVDESVHFIKRVVGVPGDKVEFRGKDVFINGELVAKERVTDLSEIERVTGMTDPGGEIYKEKLGESVHYVRYLDRSEGYTRNSEAEVPADSFFVAGDNRDDSKDSRVWGMVPRANIKGRAEMVWLSLANDGGMRQKIRWGRLFTGIR